MHWLLSRITLGRILLPTLLWLGMVSTEAQARTSSSEPKTETTSDPLPAPKVELTVSERGPGLPWMLSIVNQDERKIRVTFDPRLLWFEVLVPGKKKSEICRLPANLFPSRPDRKFTYRLKPGHRLTQTFDPRLYCFAAGGQWRLVPGALIKPRFGWPEKRKVRWRRGKRIETVDSGPPFVIHVKKNHNRSPQAIIKGDSFALRSSYAAWSRTKVVSPSPAPSSPHETAPQPVLTTVLGSDAQAERTATVTLKLTNPHQDRRLRVYFRRELVTFEVMGPDGLVTCNSSPDQRAPQRQAFLSLRPKRSITVTSRLIELCPGGTFSRPGLYLINARFDATHSGRRFGLDAYVGRVISRQPALIRVQTGERPFAALGKIRRQ